MKSRIPVLLATAVGCGVVAMLGMQQGMSGASPENPAGIRVLVALTDIGPGVELSDENVHFVEMPPAVVPADAVISRKQYQEHISLIPLSSGDVIQTSSLGMNGDSRIMPGDPPRGMRLVSIVDNSAQNVPLRRGDRVDVLVTYQAETAQGDVRTKTKTFLNYLEVFATEKSVSNDARQRRVVSLLVTPEQVDYISLAGSRGQFALVYLQPGCLHIPDFDPEILVELEEALPLQ